MQKKQSGNVSLKLVQKKCARKEILEKFKCRVKWALMVPLGELTEVYLV